MSHFAQLDENSIVKRVLVCDNNMPNEGHDWLVETFGGTWVQTSYNKKFRKHFAGVGYTYDKARDAFIPPKPYNSWIFNEENLAWDAPIPYPDVEEGERYYWDEDQTSWTLIQ